MVPMDLNIGFKGLALIQGQIYNLDFVPKNLTPVIQLKSFSRGVNSLSCNGQNACDNLTADIAGDLFLMRFKWMGGYRNLSAGLFSES